MSKKSKVIGASFRANNEIMVAVDKFHEGFASLKSQKNAIHFLVIISTLSAQLLEEASSRELVDGMLHSLLDGETLAVEFEDMGSLQ